MNEQESRNLAFVLDWWREVVQGGHLDLTTKYQAEDCIQHNPNVPTGRAAFVEFFRNVVGVKPKTPIPAKLDPEPVVKGAKGDFVFVVFEQQSQDPSREYAWDHFDLIRVENGLIKEHWDEAVIAPPR